MRRSNGRVTQIQLDHLGRRTAWIACPTRSVPAPGQYLKACNLTIPMEVLPTPLFASGSGLQGFLAAPPIPDAWLPGTEIDLFGPLGSGFQLNHSLRHLAAAAIGDVARLLPLVAFALEQGSDITLFTNTPVPALPASVEVARLSALPEALLWADYLALDIPRGETPNLRAVLGLGPDKRIPCPAQALIYTAMPCTGVAECGICAVQTRHGWKLACQDGPVFDLGELEW
jgi:hypothetical protein